MAWVVVPVMPIPRGFVLLMASAMSGVCPPQTMAIMLCAPMSIPCLVTVALVVLSNTCASMTPACSKIAAWIDSLYPLAIRATASLYRFLNSESVSLALPGVPALVFVMVSMPVGRVTSRLRLPAGAGTAPISTLSMMVLTEPPAGMRAEAMALKSSPPGSVRATMPAGTSAPAVPVTVAVTRLRSPSRLVMLTRLAMSSCCLPTALLTERPLAMLTATSSCCANVRARRPISWPCGVSGARSRSCPRACRNMPSRRVFQVVKSSPMIPASVILMLRFPR